jgi:Undecaprenyl-phosphate glucose phosphotransferase
MLARYRQIFATGIFVLDGMLIAAAWVGAYFLRFHGLGMPAPLGIPPLGFYLWVGAIVTLVSLLVLRTFRIYRSARTSRLSQEVYAIVQAVATVTAVAALASFFTRGELSRSVLLIFALLCAFALIASRVIVRHVLRALRARGYNLRRVLIAGTGENARQLVAKIAEHPDYGFIVVGLIAARREDAPATLDGLPVIGAVSDLPGLMDSQGVDLLYLAFDRHEFEAEEDALHRMSDSTAAVRLVPDLSRTFTINASIEDFDGKPIVLVTESPWQGWNAVAKRTLDIAFSALALLVLWPLMLLIALWVKLDSPGPVFYTQERVGLNGRRFHMIKFRTMRMDAESAGEGWTRPGDPRRTGAGVFLRKLSLDELPQFWNVFVGHMSLVGPRPERPMYVDRFRASIPRYMLRHHVKAGITGWAQVNGLRGDTPLERRIEYDLYYIRNWSVFFDLKIMALTVLRVFRDATAH